MSDASGWSPDQIGVFAKRFARAHGGVWPICVDRVRDALIDSFVLDIVLRQMQRSIDLGEIRTLRRQIAIALHRNHQMASGAREDLATPDPGCEACVARSTRGLGGQCPACANDRTRDELVRSRGR